KAGKALLNISAVTFPATLGVAAALGRFDRRRALVALALVLAVGAVAVRVLLAIPAGWVYPTTWLSMMVLWIVQGTFSWGVAGMVHDTRQAKRLFPLYGAGLILGGALGGVATGPLAAWLHAENLVLVWAGALVAAYLVAGAATGGRRVRRAHHVHGRRPPETGLLEALRDGARFIRRSPLLRWMSAAMVVLALLSFAVSLPFATAVTARFPEADRLAAFLGVFQGVTYAVALALSLLVANRLFARVGVATVVLTFPLLYAVGFAGAAAFAGGFGPLVGLRFVQLAWMYGAWQMAWQALFNVVPPEHRDRARTFMDGAAMQAGIVLAGALLLLAQQTLTLRQLFLVAAACAVLAAVAAAGARRAYAGAVGEALRAGWPEVFVAEEEPFGGIAWDRGALAALERGASDPDPGTRRVAMEMLAGVPLPEAAALRVAGLSDPDAAVRAAAVAAVARFPDPSALPRALDLLSDPDPVVRAEAAAAVSACSRAPGDVAGPLGRLLEDPDARVRVRAAVALARTGEVDRAVAALRRSGASPEAEERAAAVRALGLVGEEAATVAERLRDADPAVRRAAAEALAGFPAGPADEGLFDALGDPAPAVREAAATALARRGAPVAGRLGALLSDERRAEAALLALADGAAGEREPIEQYAAGQRHAALRYHAAWRRVAARGRDPRAALLAYAVRSKALAHARRALVAEGALGDRSAVEMALEGLASRDPGQRANALEMIEAVAAPGVVRPLAAVWDPEPDPAGDGLAAALEMLEDPDPWIRACAAQALAGGDGARAALAALAERDPDRLVRETAARAAREEDGMRTLSTLSLMERMMALRQVPLFRELAPGDLRRVAEAAVEHLYPHGTLLAESGEPGDAMHVVVSGEVRVVAEEPGGPTEIARRGPGYIVGEMAILSDQPRMASLVADGDVRTLSLDRARFQRILRDRPDAALAVVRELCDRLRQAHAQARAAS
ncbi:MAG TPA: HEAT repeat domain-containing protein, partial [Actinomycetota bacterium]|nr:HEAT repeat domain-containing protein [Actinomycetota bacterium]